MTRVGVVIGHPKAGSRTHVVAAEFADALVHALGSPSVVSRVDLAELAERLLVADDPQLRRGLEQVSAADVIVLVTPTYKATYTGILKVFLDGLPHRALESSVAVPIATAATTPNALVTVERLGELACELGATTPAAGGVAIAEPELAEGTWLTTPEVTAVLTDVVTLVRARVST